jgi:hypothetical protein
MTVVLTKEKRIYAKLLKTPVTSSNLNPTE